MALDAMYWASEVAVVTTGRRAVQVGGEGQVRDKLRTGAWWRGERGQDWTTTLNPHQAGRDATALPPPLLSTPRLGGSLWLPLKTLVPVAYLLPHPG